MIESPDVDLVEKFLADYITELGWIMKLVVFVFLTLKHLTFPVFHCTFAVRAQFV